MFEKTREKVVLYQFYCKQYGIISQGVTSSNDFAGMKQVQRLFRDTEVFLLFELEIAKHPHTLAYWLSLITTNPKQYAIVTIIIASILLFEKEYSYC